MIKAYLTEMLLGLFFAIAIVGATYATATATSTFVYQGF